LPLTAAAEDSFNRLFRSLDLLIDDESTTRRKTLIGSAETFYRLLWDNNKRALGMTTSDFPQPSSSWSFSHSFAVTVHVNVKSNSHLEHCVSECDSLLAFWHKKAYSFIALATMPVTCKKMAQHPSTQMCQ